MINTVFSARQGQLPKLPGGGELLMDPLCTACRRLPLEPPLLPDPALATPKEVPSSLELPRMLLLPDVEPADAQVSVRQR